MDEMNSKLIELVQSEPCIYDKTHVYYSNKDHVKQIWEKISIEMQLTVPVCQKRWRYLRDYFVRQLHMTKNDSRKSYWALFNRMLFLAPFSSTRKARLINDNNDGASSNTCLTRKRRRTGNPIKSWENDQNVLSVSSNSSYGNDEFNSFDYLNLYQAHFGYIDNDILMQLTKQGNIRQKSEEHENINLPLEIEIKSPVTDDINDKVKQNYQFQSNGFLPDEEKHFLSDTSGAKNSEKNSEDYRLNNLDNNKLMSSDDVKTENIKDFSINENINITEPSTVFSTNTKQNKVETLNELLEILKGSENIDCDEHEYFFKSLLSNVRKIDEHLIMPFRAEILKVVMKFIEMSTKVEDEKQINNNCRIDLGYNINDDDEEDEDDVVVIDTGETNWRQKLKRY